MIMRHILGLIIFFSLGCNGQTNEQELSKLKGSEETNPPKEQSYLKSLSELKLSSDTAKNYDQVKRSIKKLQQDLRQVDLSKDSIRVLFQTSLLNRIIPFWEGTTWSFEGHTARPQDGEIACGYFVSTTLKHVGVNLNRYRLAQQNPLNEAKTLALGAEMIEVSEHSVEENSSAIKKLIQEGIYFIGFDQSHVGYLLKEKDELYLIHSNYIDSKGVEIEHINESDVFSSYNRFFIVAISTNNTLLEYWLSGKEVVVITKD